VKRLIALIFAACAAASVLAQPPRRPGVPIVEKAVRLKPGQFVWDEKADASGPVFLLVDLSVQRALLYRNNVPIAASTISTGSGGHETPTGTFMVLQKEVAHRSRTYDDAPMPYMQRLTWKGVSMHAGHLPGYPASHGCIRVPSGFAKLLYRVTRLGTTVIITNRMSSAASGPPRN
jgi:lipoprotein-anchoring transpeptidase ErfK/SrfK